MRGIPFAAALLASASAPATLRAQATQQQQPSAKAAADAPARTPGGATFTAPAGWTSRQGAGFVELTPPEGDFRIAIVDVASAADAKAATAAAWAAWAPAKAKEPKLVSASAARNGWEERWAIDYETSPNEKRIMAAGAMRAGGKWTVLIYDGAQATAEKRGAAAGLVNQSLRPAGYTRESFAGKTAHPMDAARIAQLRSFLETSMRELGVPGASFALTDRKGTFHSAGIGVRELGKPAPVDADTEFLIASNTKGLATLLLAKLADEGKLRWDQPVTQLYPDFRLGSAETTSKVLVKHLVCACTGLPRKDLQVILNSDPDAAAKDTFVQLAATQPTSGFGEVFQYNNLMAAAAGYVGAHLLHPDMELGAAFDRSMDEKIFGPLGMKATTFDFATAMRGNWARPHADSIANQPTVTLGSGMGLNRAFTRYAGAGGAWSSANDLAKYVRFELNEGKLDDGRQWVTKANLMQRRVPTVPVGEDRFYGMGLQVDRDYGIDVVHHGGSLAGYKSDILILPDAGIGAVLLTNADNGQAMLRPFQRRLLELLYDGKPEAAAEVAATAKRNRAEIAKEAELVQQVPDSAAVAALAPAYVNEDLGRIDVARSGNGVTFRFRTLSSAMGTKKNEDGSVSFIALDPTILFWPITVGEREGLKVLFVRDGQHEFVFTPTV